MEYRVTDTELRGIADAIREKTGTSELLAWNSGYISALEDIPVPSGSISFSQNGTYNVSAFADAVVDVPQPSGSISFSQNGTYDVSSYANAVVSVSMVIPSEYNNFLIVMREKSGSIYDDEEIIVMPYAFFDRKSLTSIEMPNVESIGSAAFGSCGSLISVTMPKCSYIDANAFKSCYRLKDINFSSCVYIGTSAFCECSSSLTSINFPKCEYIGESAFYSCYKLSDISFPECLYIGKYAFGACRLLRNVNFPKCSYIGVNAFTNCSFDTISFPQCLSIDDSAFIQASLSNINFPLCSYIGKDAFGRCGSLITASFPSVEMIESWAFRKCQQLESLYLMNSVACSLGNSEVFSSTPMLDSSYLGYFGSIYVPSSLISTYQTMSNWSYYSDRIVAYTE